MKTEQLMEEKKGERVFCCAKGGFCDEWRGNLEPCRDIVRGNCMFYNAFWETKK